MLNSRHFRRLAAIIGGFWGGATAMDYEPFPNCTEVAQLDSSRKWVFIDESLDPNLAPFTGYDRYQYIPRSCHPMQVVQQPYYLPDQVYRIDYHLGLASGAFDFVWTVTGTDSGFINGTAYFSPLGEMDSSAFWFTRELESGGFDTVYMQNKTTKTPKYQLIRNYERVGHGPWEFVWGDSIVASAAGKTIYSVDLEDTVLTECGNVGPTYVCEESPSSNGSAPRKSIWFLTQGRKDSLQTWENGELISTEKYFWSARSAGIRAQRVRAKVSAASSFWDEYDIMGRTKSNRTKPDWMVSGKTKSNGNKAWPRMQY